MANGDNSTNLWAWIAGVIAAIIFFILMDIVILPSTKILTLLFGYSIGGIGILIVIIFIVIIIFRSEEHTLNSSHNVPSRMPSSA